VQKYILRQDLSESIEKESIPKIVPSEVKLKKKKDDMPMTIDEIIKTCKFQESQRDDLERFLLSLSDEQEVLFRKLVLTELCDA
jgi:hypothetical protein